MKPPGRNSDSSTRQPANGSAKMMQHAGRLDDVEGPADGAELEDIGLRIFDIGHAQFAGLAQRIGEAGQAEIDRQHAGAGESAARSRSHAVRCRSRRSARRARPCRGCGTGQPGIALRRYWSKRSGCLRRIGLRPARIGIFLVLLPHLARDVVLDRRQRRDRGAQRPLGRGLADLLVQDIGKPGRPRLIQDRLDARHRMQRQVIAEHHQPQRGNLLARRQLAR